MTKPQVREQLIEILRASSLSPEAGLEITDVMSFTNDLKADSLDSAELVMKIKEVFDITIPDADVSKLKTIGAAINYVFEALARERG